MLPTSSPCAVHSSFWKCQVAEKEALPIWFQIATVSASTLSVSVPGQTPPFSSLAIPRKTGPRERKRAPAERPSSRQVRDGERYVLLCGQTSALFLHVVDLKHFLIVSKILLYRVSLVYCELLDLLLRLSSYKAAAVRSECGKYKFLPTPMQNGKVLFTFSPRITNPLFSEDFLFIDGITLR